MKRIILVLLGMFILTAAYCSPKEIINKVYNTDKWEEVGTYNDKPVYQKDDIALVFETHWVDKTTKVGYGIKLLNMSTKERLLLEVESYAECNNIWKKIIFNNYSEWENFVLVEVDGLWYKEVNNETR